MPRYAYDRLTALDSSFLYLERPNAYMHVASTMVFDAGPLGRPDGGIDADAIRRRIASVLHLIPRYRQKLAWVPLAGHPVWIDDAEFSLDFHVRHTALPRPGSDEQLKRLSARIMQQHLDRERPLWEMWIVEGLERNRFAIVSKVHHCMIDGISGVDIMRVLLSPAPAGEAGEPPRFVPRPAPGRLELLGAELLRTVSLPFAAVRDLRAFVREAADARREVLVRARAALEAVGASLRWTTETPLNGPIGQHRRFDWLRMDVGELKAVRRALGGTLNDVVLTIVTGAVRRFLRRRNVNPGAVAFRVMTPVSVRAESERGTLGNRVSAWFVDLPIDEADLRRQLERIGAATTALKESKQAVGAEMLTRVADWTPSTLLSLAARNVTRLLPFNMVVTNVPGPQQPMYLLGARLRETYPHVPIMDNLGLGVALLSGDGVLCWGITADWDRVPDVDEFIRALDESFADLRALAGIEPRPATVAPGAQVGHAA